MITLEVDFRFEAGHHLPNVPAGHKCGRRHGHSYHCTALLDGDIGAASGWLVDYADVKAAAAPVVAEVDHHYLNDVEGLSNPTSENLARWVWGRLTLPGLSKIVVHETCTAGCVYQGEPAWG